MGHPDSTRLMGKFISGNHLSKNLQPLCNACKQRCSGNPSRHDDFCLFACIAQTGE
jgi:hypothetical protein